MLYVNHIPCYTTKIEAKLPLGVFFVFFFKYVDSLERFVNFHSYILGSWTYEDIRLFYE